MGEEVEQEGRRMIELKRCPFCGGEPKPVVRYSNEGVYGALIAAVICDGCGAERCVRLAFNSVNEIKFDDIQSGMNAACERWNRRAKDDRH